MYKHLETDVKVGVFISLGIGLVMLAIILLGGPQTFLEKQNHYYVHFDEVGELIPGAKVVLNGIRVGMVEAIDLDDKEKNVVVKVIVNQKYAKWIRESSTAQISTQGMLGDKYIYVEAGKFTDPEMKDGARIHTVPPQSITQFLSSGDQLLKTVNGVAASLERVLRSLEANQRGDTIFKNLAKTSENLTLATEQVNQKLQSLEIKTTVDTLNAILKKINNGTGTLGALINDPALYHDAKTLVGGANRNRVMRNLVRKTIRDAEATE